MALFTSKVNYPSSGNKAPAMVKWHTYLKLISEYLDEVREVNVSYNYKTERYLDISTNLRTSLLCLTGRPSISQ